MTGCHEIYDRMAEKNGIMSVLFLNHISL